MPTIDKKLSRILRGLPRPFARNAAASLSQIRDYLSDQSALTELVLDPSAKDRLRAAGIWVLSMLGPNTIIPVLSELLGDESLGPKSLWEAAKAAIRTPRRDIYVTLCDMLQSRIALKRQVAVWALGLIGRQSVNSRLQGLLRED